MNTLSIDTPSAYHPSQTLAGSNPPKHRINGYMKAEVKKLKRSPILIAHLAITLSITAVFLAYFSFSPQYPISKIDSFFSTIGCGMPFVIGLFCGLAVEQERGAGSCANLLGSSHRRTALTAKLLVYIGLGFSCVLTATGVFFLGMTALGQNPLGFMDFLAIACWLMLGSAGLYCIFFPLAFHFGRNTTIGLGVGGSLVGALMLTGMGHLVWNYLPFAWPARFATSAVSLMTLTREPLQAQFVERMPFLFSEQDVGVTLQALTQSLIADVNLALIVCVLFTAVSVVLFLAYASRFQSKGSHE